jgi:hypothetical protein
LQEGSIPVDNSPEQIELLLSGLIAKDQGQLRAFNRIYERVFNLDYIEKQLQTIRPYTAHLNAWIASNYQDDLQLLHGEALGHIQAWAKGKTLSIDDYRFLVASQKRD